MKRNDICAAAFLVILTALFFGATQTITSGYHFIDDHEILRINKDLAEDSTFSVAAKWMKRDLNIRLRPAYYLHRVLETKTLGVNFTLWSIYTMFLLIVSLLAFYYATRRLGFSIPESFCFLFVAFIGPQASVWWRLGPAETIGTTFLALAFFFMTHAEKRHLLFTSLFCFFLICASLCKETYLIVAPAFLIFKIWREKEMDETSILKTVSKNRLLLVPFFVTLTGLFLIIAVIGVNKIEYAGVSGGLATLIKGGISILRSQFKDDFLKIACFLGIACAIIRVRNERFLFLKKTALPFLFFALVVGSNIVIYAKSGMRERYLLPSMVGVAFVTVSIIKETRIRSAWLSYLFLAVVFLSGGNDARDALNESRRFAKEGQQNKALFSAILQNHEKGSRILFVADPVRSYERSFAVNTYLREVKNIRVFAYSVEPPESWEGWSDFRRGLATKWRAIFAQRLFSDMPGAPNMILFHNALHAERFFEETGIDKMNYKSILTGDTKYAVFLEK